MTNSATALVRIDECFNDRLTGKKIRFVEDYVNNRFGLVIRMHRAGEGNGKWLALCINSCPSNDGISTSIGSDKRKTVFKLKEVSDDQQDPVFADIVEFVEFPDKRRIIRSLVRLYSFENEGLSLWEGLIYRKIRAFGVIDTVREIFPRLFSGKMKSLQTQASTGTPEPSPKIISHAIEIVNCVTGMEDEFSGHELSWSDGYLGGITVIIDSQNIRVVGDRLFNEIFDSADVFLGPFNLEF